MGEGQFFRAEPPDRLAELVCYTSCRIRETSHSGEMKFAAGSGLVLAWAGCSQAFVVPAGTGEFFFMIRRNTALLRMPILPVVFTMRGRFERGVGRKPMLSAK